MPNAIPSTAQKSANGQRPRSANPSTPASRPQPPHASICHGVCGPWPRNMLDAIAASAPTAKPRRGPSATPAAATITVTGCTLGIGAKSTRPAAAMPPSVATSVRSRAVPPPCSSQANPPATSANAASTVARPPSAGSSAAQTTPAIPSATNATRATLDRNGHLRGRAEPNPPVRGQQRIVRRDEDAATLARPRRAARRRAPPCGRGRSRAWARRARADRARRPTRLRRRGARAPRSRGRAGGGTSANARPNRVERGGGARLVTADPERDLVERRLSDEVAAGILREVRRAAGPGRETANPARAAPPRSSRASSCRCRSAPRGRRSRRG